MARFNPITYPSRMAQPSKSDRYEQLQQNDLEQQHLDLAREQVEGAHRPDLMEQLKTLYGISQQAQLMPEQLRHLQLENQGAEQALPGQLQHQQDEHSIIGAQTNAFEGKAMPQMTPEHVMYGVQAGYIPHEVAGAYFRSHSDPNVRAAWDTYDAGKRAEQAKALNPGGDVTPAPGVSFDPRFANDPAYKRLMQDSNTDNEYLKPGGGADLDVAKDNLNRQVHPISQFFRDLYSLYQ